MSKLDQLAVFGKKIKPCNIHDPNYGEVFRHHIAYKIKPFRIHISISDSKFRVEIKGFNSPYLFSINSPDVVCGVGNLLDLGHRIPNDVYVLPGEELVRDWFSDEDNLMLIEQLQLQPTEMLVAYKNAIGYYCNTLTSLDNTVAQLLKIIDRLCVNNGRDVAAEINWEGLPLVLKPLIPFLSKWAISDDGEREDAIAGISTAERQQLLEIAVPLLGDIDEYLSNCGEPLSDEAILIGSFAEFIAELELDA